MKCSACNKELAAGLRFCTGCGAPIPEDEVPLEAFDPADLFGVVEGTTPAAEAAAPEPPETHAAPAPPQEAGRKKKGARRKASATEKPLRKYKDLRSAQALLALGGVITFIGIITAMGEATELNEVIEKLKQLPENSLLRSQSEAAQAQMMKTQVFIIVNAFLLIMVYASLYRVIDFVFDLAAKTSAADTHWFQTVSNVVEDTGTAFAQQQVVLSELSAELARMKAEQAARNP